MNYKLEEDTSDQELTNILKKTVNMLKMNREENKDLSVKTI